ncbi:MAG: hypothetical protein HC925_06445 [Coleofasciculaceae cyanobacterium SM2_3_26]|nr:hypothetical protein [Coleofasciculaceae cyanobacterium SM2_3_26]
MSITQLTLNLGQSSVSLHFTPEAARELQQALGELMQRLKAVAAKAGAGGGKPAPQKPVEYRHRGEVYLEVFCNPNIWASPFAAKVLVAVRDDRIQLSAEAELTRIVEDVNLYLEQVG